MTQHDDNLVFDRLADGELSLAERQELLSSLDAMSSIEGRADGWRRCALALLEAQVWRSEFKSFVTQEAPTTNIHAKVLENGRMATPRGPRWLESSLALAASALVAFGIGWSINSPQVTTDTGERLISNDFKQPAGDSREAVTLLVKDDQGKHQRLRLPLVDAAELGEQFSELSPAVPAQLRASLQDRGFDIESKRRFAPLFFEQNNELVPMVVPVNDTYVVPVNSPVY
jgi:hypothetical protein